MILQAVRKAVGEDYIVAVRFGACDYMDGGSEISDIPDAVKAFDAAGADLIGVGRALLKDPVWSEKALSGEI